MVIEAQVQVVCLQIHECKYTWYRCREFTISIIYILSLECYTLFETLAMHGEHFFLRWRCLSKRQVFLHCIRLPHHIFSLQELQQPHSYCDSVEGSMPQAPRQTSNIWHRPPFVDIIAESKPWDFWISTGTKYHHPVHSVKRTAAKSHSLEH